MKLVFLEFKILLMFFWSLLQVPCRALSISGSLFLVNAEIILHIPFFCMAFLDCVSSSDIVADSTVFLLLI